MMVIGSDGDGDRTSFPVMVMGIHGGDGDRISC